MNDCENKSRFVSNIGTALLVYSKERISSMKYEKDPNGSETVNILMLNGTRKIVNVTGDSCIAIMNDIYRALM